MKYKKYDIFQNISHIFCIVWPGVRLILRGNLYVLFKKYILAHMFFFSYVAHQRAYLPYIVNEVYSQCFHVVFRLKA